jgi:hypothetical protein
MLKKYISSSLNDLEKYRLEVTKTIRPLGHNVTTMVYNVAEDIRPIAQCMEDIAEYNK